MRAKLKDTIRSILKGRSRYLSILLIVAIGVGFFAGVKATSPDMVLSADRYEDEQQIMHYRVLSTWGFDEEDIAALRKIRGADVRASYFMDVISKVNEKDSTARVYAYQSEETINDIWLKAGKWPRTSNECVAEASSSLQIGSVVTLETEDLENTEYTVVGLIRSGMYLSSFEKGNTNVGNGEISQILYVPEKNFKSDYYTEVYIIYEDMQEALAYSDEYLQLEDEHKDDLEVIAAELTQLRHDRTVEDGMAQIDAAQAQIDAGFEQILSGWAQLREAKEQLGDGRKQYEEGKQQIVENEQKIVDGEAEINTQAANLNGYQSQLSGAKNQYYAGQSQYQAAREEANAQFAEAQGQLDDAKSQLDSAKALLDAAVLIYGEVESYYQTEMAAAQARLEELTGDNSAEEWMIEEAKRALTEIETFSDQAFAEAKARIEARQEEYDAANAEYESALNEFNTKKAAAEAELNRAKGELNSSYSQIQSAEWQLQSGQSQLSEAREQLEVGKAELEQGKEQLAASELQLLDAEKQIRENEQQLMEKQQELLDAQLELTAKKKELQALENPSWYIFTRNDNAGYEEFGQNAERINNIAKVFPVFFILVAALVVLTTMTRMIEEERTQIGTMKALGYSDFSILGKYLLYTLSATLIGSLTGLVIGYQIFPWTIMSAYSIMYYVDTKVMPFYWSTAILITLAAMAVTGLVVFLCFIRLFRSMPSQLMRPKAPKKGKRVLLERIPILWRHMSFSQKVTVRNLFRYKKRMIMTIVGIMGCTALSLTGFGLSDSINGIVYHQFDRIWNYSGIVAVNEIDDTDYDEIHQIMLGYDADAECMKTIQKSYTFEHDDHRMSGTLMVCESAELMADMICFQNRLSKEVFTPQEGSVLVTEKMASRLGLEAGDEIEIRISDVETRSVPVQGIVENYAMHYVYMLPETYESLMAEAPEYNMIMARYDLSPEKADELAAEWNTNEHVLTVVQTADSKASYTRLLEALDLVVWVLILSAALLAFVVLYNLSNINITERVREIATLEVLGFNDREVSGYVFRESILLTLIGTGFGLLFGVYLCNFVIVTAEIDLVMFGREIKPLSFILAAVLTIVFSQAVNLIMHKPLRKISMVESLKSVE